jgi:hypothetical protein
MASSQPSRAVVYAPPRKQRAASSPYQHLDRGQRIFEKVARLESDASLKLVLPDVTLEDGPHRGEIVAVANKMRMAESDLGREAALRAADVGEALVLVRRERVAIARAVGHSSRSSR